MPNARPASDAATLAALEPGVSAVIRASAGSGKTWMLAARILRALLAGSEPRQILALTFTRRAAAEIRERVGQWLQFLALESDERVQDFLRERGLSKIDAALMQRARQLWPIWLQAKPGAVLATFDSWFAQLLEGAPLGLGVSARRLEPMRASERSSVWNDWANALGREILQAQDGHTLSAQALALQAELIESGSELALRKSVQALGKNGAAWHLLPPERLQEAQALIEKTGSEPAASRAEQEAAAEMASEAQTLEQLRLYASWITQSQTKAVEGAEQLLISLEAKDAHAILEQASALLLTAKGTVRQPKVSRETLQRIAQTPEQFMHTHEALAQRCLTAQQNIRAHIHAVRSSRALLLGVGVARAQQDWREQQQRMNYEDCVWQCVRLMEEPGYGAGQIQARLDTRFRHILIDEFQDTAPLQWRILRAWLEAYAQGDAERPSVFLVGDPRQSIYGFRGAESGLFEEVAGFLRQHFAAQDFFLGASRRSAPPVMDLVNALLAVQEQSAPDTTHTTHRQSLSGRVELLPLIVLPRAPKALAAADDAPLRDPLTTQRGEAHTANDPEQDDAEEDEGNGPEQEAALIAARLSAMIGKWNVAQPEGERALRAGDVMILARRKKNLTCIAQALAERGFAVQSQTGSPLLRTQVAQDLAALLHFLASPHDDLNLAHTLRTPLFAASHADLLWLKQQSERGENTGRAWWPALAAADAEALSPALERARVLLGGWLDLAPRLPVHDLLGRITHESDAAERYCAQLPEAEQRFAQAHLREFLQLALSEDAGRYPSLTRFARRLQEYRSAEDEEEVPRVAELGSLDAVRLLSIHGAKGLEAPLVWLADANARARGLRAGDWLQDWPLGQPRPLRLALCPAKELRAPDWLQAMREQQQQRAQREENNLLYVALTRAQQYFLVSGSMRGERRAPADAPLTYWQQIEQALQKLGAQGGVWGAELPAELSPFGLSQPPFGLSLSKPLVLVSQPFDRLRANGEDKLSPNGEEEHRANGGEQAQDERRNGRKANEGLQKLPSENESGKAFGRWLHRILERGLQARREPGAPEEIWQSAWQAAQRITLRADLRRFFDPAQYQRALSEVELVLADGSVGRIDRLVISADGWWVLDYKSGQGNAVLREEYEQQLARYSEALAPIAARASAKVFTRLVFVDEAAALSATAPVLPISPPLPSR